MVPQTMSGFDRKSLLRFLNSFKWVLTMAWSCLVFKKVWNFLINPYNFSIGIAPKFAKSTMGVWNMSFLSLNASLFRCNFRFVSVFLVNKSTQLISGLVALTGITDIGNEQRNRFQLNKTVADPSHLTKYCRDEQSLIRNPWLNEEKN